MSPSFYTPHNHYSASNLSLSSSICQYCIKMARILEHNIISLAKGFRHRPIPRSILAQIPKWYCPDKFSHPRTQPNIQSSQLSRPPSHQPSPPRSLSNRPGLPSRSDQSSQSSESPDMLPFPWISCLTKLCIVYYVYTRWDPMISITQQRLEAVRPLVLFSLLTRI